MARPTQVAAILVRTSKDTPLAQRLMAVHAAVSEAIATHRPDVVAVERVLFSSNVASAMATGQAAGVVMLAAAQCGLEVVMYSPNEVKQSVTGDGSADKDAVARMVQAQLRLDAPPKPADVADALAVALCHLGRARLHAAMGESSNRLADAIKKSGASSSSSWEQVLNKPHIRVAGGTAAARQSRRGSHT